MTHKVAPTLAAVAPIAEAPANAHGAPETAEVGLRQQSMMNYMWVSIDLPFRVLHGREQQKNTYCRYYVRQS